MARYLFVIAKSQSDLHTYLSQAFSGSSEVRIVLDRRLGERRRHAQEYRPERRRSERRKPGLAGVLEFPTLGGLIWVNEPPS